MAHFAPKLFSNDPNYLQQEIFDIISDDNGLEVALYGYNEFSTFISEKIQQIPSHKKIIHLWQKHVYLLGLIEQKSSVKESFLWEVEQFKKLNIFKAVIHNNKAETPLVVADIKKYAADSLSAIEFAQNNGILLHIENTFERLSFFNVLFEEYEKLNIIKNIGFCLDTGHARLYSESTLDEWLMFIANIQSLGASIHYHIHANDGCSDQHLPLSIAQQNGLLEPIESWTPKGYIPWLSKAINTTPNSIFCLEHPSFQAREALAYINLLKENNEL